MPLRQIAGKGNPIWLREVFTVLASHLGHVSSFFFFFLILTAMKRTKETHKGLWIIVVILNSSWLLTSGTLLPKLNNSGRLWKREASQYTPGESSDDLKVSLFPWHIRSPSITLRDWSLKWMSSDVSAPQEEDSKDHGEDRTSHLWDPVRQEGAFPGGQRAMLYPSGWVPGWGGKRSIVVADDTAFREKSKMLTAMERQKWLNSYMQKFLVVNSN
uniref:Tuberoinfundibular peptide of 39 residues n=1 Tax=Anolis carolinensis TaxID=28377 RepID=A0A803TKK6_ANOCA|nr:PREDICTED: tuberoinfundibular peptide of 39 residues [Anolis carolinensis]|eukprot:XP_008117110.1 PREDICTED: tuberoinfundibular peptide of 39 residues [Anolis carolinensis]